MGLRAPPHGPATVNLCRGLKAETRGRGGPGRGLRPKELVKIC